MLPASPVIPGYEFRETIFSSPDPEVKPLPAVITQNGEVLTRWELSEDERERIAEGQDVYLWITTHGKPLQPICLGVYEPNELIENDDEKEAGVAEEWPEVIGGSATDQ